MLQITFFKPPSTTAVAVNTFVCWWKRFLVLNLSYAEFTSCRSQIRASVDTKQTSVTSGAACKPREHVPTFPCRSPNLTSNNVWLMKVKIHKSVWVFDLWGLHSDLAEASHKRSYCLALVWTAHGALRPTPILPQFYSGLPHISRSLTIESWLRNHGRVVNLLNP